MTKEERLEELVKLMSAGYISPGYYGYGMFGSCDTMFFTKTGKKSKCTKPVKDCDICRWREGAIVIGGPIEGEGW